MFNYVTIYGGLVFVLLTPGASFKNHDMCFPRGSTFSTMSIIEQGHQHKTDTTHLQLEGRGQEQHIDSTEQQVHYTH